MLRSLSTGTGPFTLRPQTSMGLRIRFFILILLLLFLEQTVLLHDLIHAHSGWVESAEQQVDSPLVGKAATQESAPHSETKVCGLCLAMAGCSALLVHSVAALPIEAPPRDHATNRVIRFYSRDLFDLRSRGPPPITPWI